MNLLDEFIDQHYIGSERDELAGLLNKYELDVVLANVVNTYEKELLKGHANLLPMAASFASTSLIAINQKMPLIVDSEEKQKVKKAVSGMSIRLFLGFIRQFPDEALSVASDLANSLRITCSVMGYDYTDLQLYFNPDQLRFLIQDISGGNAAASIHKVTGETKRRLEWTGKGVLDYLSHEMKNRKWIEKKVQWTNFLDPGKEPVMVLCCPDHKAHVAHLLFSLYREKYIRPKGTRGYFAIAQIYLRDYSNQPFARNALKKLSSNIILAPDKFADVIEDVKEVMGAINFKPKDYTRD